MNKRIKALAIAVTMLVTVFVSALGETTVARAEDLTVEPISSMVLVQEPVVKTNDSDGNSTVLMLGISGAVLVLTGGLAVWEENRRSRKEEN